MKQIVPALLLLSLACATTGAREEPPKDLRSRADALVAQAEAEGSLIGAYVADAKTGDVLYAHREHARSNSASTMKLASTAAALAAFGPDYRYNTSIELHGRQKGELFEGDLVITASGDPSFGSRRFPVTARLPRLIVQAMQARGIRQWQGRVRVEGAEWRPENVLGPGWAWDDVALDYSAPPTPFVFQDNVVKVIATRAKGANGNGCGPVSVRTEPSLSKPTVVVTIESSGGIGELSCRRQPFNGEVHCNWPLPPKRCQQEGAEWVSVDDAAALFEASVLSALQDVGVARLVPGQTVVTPERVTLLTVESPPMSELVRVTNKYSLNLYSERLALSVAKSKVGEDSFKALFSALRADQTARGIPPQDLHQVDGSGLSRYNLVSAFGLVQLLRSSLGTSYEEALLLSLPITGVDGTLRGHKLIEPARAWAKTGTLTGQRGFAGFIERPGDAKHPTLVFALLIGNSLMTRAQSNALVDRFVEVMTVAVVRDREQR